MKLLTSLLFFLSTAVVATSSANGYGNKDGSPLNYPEFESNVALLIPPPLLLEAYM